MEVVKINVDVPINLGAIKLSDYQKYLKVAKRVEKDLPQGVDSPKDNEFLNKKALEIFCKVNMSEAYKLPLNTFESVLLQLSKCFEEKTPRVDRFTMSDPTGKQIEFGLIPNLSKITFGEYIDAESYIVNWDNMHKAMAVLYRPVVYSKNDTYLIEEYEGTDKWAGVMLDMPLNVAMGALVFFYRLGSKLSRITLSYLLQQPELETHSALTTLLGKNGDGISPYMVLQEEMSRELMKLPRFHYTSA